MKSYQLGLIIVTGISLAPPVWGESGEAAAVIELLAGRPIVEHGLALDKSGGEWASIDTGGQKSHAWVSHSSPTTPGMGWMRSVRLKVTDPTFQNGRMPVCDIEVEYLLDAWSGVEVYADTARGGVRVASGWGAERKWKTLRFQLDDARFARGDTGDGSQLNSNAHDLVIYGANAPLHVRAVRICGYDLDHDPDFRRLLRLDGYTTGEPAELMLFTPGQQPTIHYQLTNLARKALAATYRWELRTRGGELLARGEQDATLAAQASGTLAVPLDTTGLAYGVYALTFSLARRGEREPIIFRESYLGVTDGRAVPKAADGEFLYGMDMKLGPSYDSQQLLQWTRQMGVDIIRHGFGPGSVEEVTRHLPTYESYGLQVLFMCDPPKEQAKRADELPGVVRKLETIASRFPQIRYYELGNEPDLTFFYPGPIEHYVEDYHQMYDAIKGANPDAVVMNGGLCFAGADATRRAEEFTRLVDRDRIDAIAYHGHGPGAASERHALERMRTVAERHGKGDLPLIETESGVAARTPAQEDMQARTVVQKMVYAQSEAMPLFIWFRLLMFEEAYGNLRSPQEPRPVVLAYRHMVQRLRGHAHESVLDLPRHLQGHVFHEPGRSGRTAVLWSEQSSSSHIALQLDDKPPTDATIHDLFGNARPLAVSSDGVATVEVGPDPVFVTWTASVADTFIARVAPALLAAPDVAHLVTGSGQPFSARLHNPYDRELRLRATATLAGDLDGNIVPTSQDLVLAPGEQTEVPMEVTLRMVPHALHWPTAWTAFIHVRSDIDLRNVTQLPDSLPGPAGEVKPRRALPKSGMVDFEQLGGTMHERETAVVFAHIDSLLDQSVRVGASADWWMAWFVNGQPVYDTLAGGNGGGYAVTDHVFDLPLRQGRNLLAVKVLSGSMGWKLLTGSPVQVAAALDPQRLPRIDIHLHEGEALLARHTTHLIATPPIRNIEADLTLESPLSQWTALAPDIILAEDALENLHEKQPDASLWWQGPDDLSAEGWLRMDGDRLLILLAVWDDSHMRAKDGQLADALAVRLAGPGMEPDMAFTLADGMVPTDISPDPQAAGERLEYEGRSVTVYRVRIDLPTSDASALQLHLQLRDTDDGRTLKQVMRWGRSIASHRQGQNSQKGVE